MKKKHCLFCDERVAIQPDGDSDRFLGCACAPGGAYGLRREDYDLLNAYSHAKKRSLFPLVSAYIRERTDGRESVSLTADDIESLINDPAIPVTVEDKGLRLLQYLYRHAKAPGEPVFIHPLSQNYNLTYSPNLQEFVYIIDLFIGKGLLIREGMSFTLTEDGWREAASAGGKRGKPCCVLLPDSEEWHAEWLEKVLPKLEQCGYQPRLLTRSSGQAGDKSPLELIGKSELILADLTGHSPEVYFAAGYACGSGIPVIWTVNRSDAGERTPLEDIRPIAWDSVDELSVILLQRLSLNA
ncbi:hypothetical protein [Gorillibacterium sp. sgz500922]|uniref:hypothetical protein n=1 Tax=Gorillibacterium sp. sgz500922 TaxID=3446694 RepID=UPI003F67D9AE